jgi:hypothetical protein
MDSTENAADDIRAGRPERYYEYVYKTYGKAFRSGRIEGIETFRELYRQVFTIGNERSTILFIKKFVPLLPVDARRKILAEFLAERRAMEQRSPEENAASRPRRITITSDDIVWYSDYSRGYLGRLDPATGKVTEWQSPSGPKSASYGISAINDIIWYSESESTPNTIVRFDPKTANFQSWAIPGGGNAQYLGDKGR